MCPGLLLSREEGKGGRRAAAAAAKSLQSCPTLCDPIEGSPPCSPIPGILQARILEWVAISFSNAQKWKVKVKSLSRVRLLVIPWAEACQAPPSMGFSRQKSTGVGLPLPSPVGEQGTLFSNSQLLLPLNAGFYLALGNKTRGVWWNKIEYKWEWRNYWKTLHWGSLQ